MEEFSIADSLAGTGEAQRLDGNDSRNLSRDAMKRQRPGVRFAMAMLSEPRPARARPQYPYKMHWCGCDLTGKCLAKSRRGYRVTTGSAEW
jgi:hypothetical protein